MTKIKVTLPIDKNDINIKTVNLDGLETTEKIIDEKFTEMEIDIEVIKFFNILDSLINDLGIKEDVIPIYGISYKDMIVFIDLINILLKKDENGDLIYELLFENYDPLKDKKTLLTIDEANTYKKILKLRNDFVYELRNYFFSDIYNENENTFSYPSTDYLCKKFIQLNNYISDMIYLVCPILQEFFNKFISWFILQNRIDEIFTQLGIEKDYDNETLEEYLDFFKFIDSDEFKLEDDSDDTIDNIDYRPHDFDNNYNP